jgi:hypothetical protein
MDQKEMQDAARALGSLRDAVYQIEGVFKQVCEGMADLQNRVAKLENGSRGGWLHMPAPAGKYDALCDYEEDE